MNSYNDLLNQLSIDSGLDEKYKVPVEGFHQTSRFFGRIGESVYDLKRVQVKGGFWALREFFSIRPFIKSCPLPLNYPFDEMFVLKVRSHKEYGLSVRKLSRQYSECDGGGTYIKKPIYEYKGKLYHG